MRRPGKPIRKGLLFALWMCAAVLSAGENRLAAAADISIQGAVYHVHRPDGSHKTYLDVVVGRSFSGKLPEDIDSITVTGPNGKLPIGITDFRYNPQWRAFWTVLPGLPAIGAYAFELKSGEAVGVATDTQSAIQWIPIPNVSAFSPGQADTETCQTPTFAWSLLNEPAPLYYQLQIRGADRRHVYRTDYVRDMHSVRLPPDLLQPGLTYQWRVRVADGPDWISLNNRSHSKWVTFTKDRNIQPCDYRYTVPVETDDGWKTSTLKTEGVDPGKIDALMQRILTADIPDIHSVLIVKNGKLVLEEYFYGNARNRLHHMMSVTKSITSLLIGIAVDQKMIAGPEEKMMTFFPGYADVVDEERKKQIRLQHVLTMTAGLEWNAWTYPEGDPRDSTVAMMQSDDWIGFVLEKPVVAPPGERYVYSNGLTTLLGEILREATGLYADQMAKKYLFAPLGISDFRWRKGAGGIVNTAGALDLRSRDMARIGIMVLEGGRWKGRQIVSAAWVKESTKAHVQQDILFGSGYGYQWWRGRTFVGGKELKVFYAAGKGGQYIFICPALELVTVVTSKWDNDGLGEMRPQLMMTTSILPAMLPEGQPRKAVPVDEKMAGKMTGEYKSEIMPWTVAVFGEGNKVFYKSPDEEQGQLFAVSETQFFGFSEDIGDFTVDFFKNQSGEITHLGVQIGFGFWRFDRIHK